MGYDPVIVGEDAAELTVELGMAMGMEIGSLGLLRPVIGELMPEWLSRRCEIEGETARRLEAVA